MHVWMYKTTSVWVPFLFNLNIRLWIWKESYEGSLLLDLQYCLCDCDGVPLVIINSLQSGLDLLLWS